MSRFSPAARISQIQAYAEVTRALPANLTAHLQNVSRKRFAVTSVAYTPMNLGISNVLLRHGFISNMTRYVRQCAGLVAQGAAELSIELLMFFFSRGPPLRTSTEAPRPEAFNELKVQNQVLHLCDLVCFALAMAFFGSAMVNADMFAP